MQAVSGVRNAGEILRLFTQTDPEWGAADASRALGLSRSYAHRLLATLVEVGLLEKMESCRRFRLSRSCFANAAVALSTDRLFSAAVPILRRLAATHRVRPALAVWAGGVMVTMHATAEPTVSFLEVGQCLSAAIVLMAGLPEVERELAVDRVRREIGPAESAALDELLAQASAGNLIRPLESPGSHHCRLAMPVLDARGHVVAALALRVDGFMRVDELALSADLQRAAAQLTNCIS